MQNLANLAGNQVGYGLELCIMAVMHYGVMHYELVDCRYKIGPTNGGILDTEIHLLFP
jgi:hypothetical protein